MYIPFYHYAIQGRSKVYIFRGRGKGEGMGGGGHEVQWLRWLCPRLGKFKKLNPRIKYGIETKVCKLSNNYNQNTPPQLTNSFSHASLPLPLFCVLWVCNCNIVYNVTLLRTFMHFFIIMQLVYI